MTSGAVERLLRAECTRRERQDSAYAVVAALDPADRLVVFARLYTLVENDHSVPGRPSGPADWSSGRYVDRAEAYVRACFPGGASTRHVAEAIGQKVSSVDGSLRWLMKQRKTVERRDGLWHARKP